MPDKLEFCIPNSQIGIIRVDEKVALLYPPKSVISEMGILVSCTGCRFNDRKSTRRQRFEKEKSLELRDAARKRTFTTYKGCVTLVDGGAYWPAKVN